MLPRKTDRKKSATTKDVLAALKEATDTLGISKAEISDVVNRQVFDIDKFQIDQQEEEEDE